MSRIETTPDKGGTDASATQRWFARTPARTRRSLTVICLPYAGGGAQIFRSWPDALPSGVEMWAVRLPGRENRFGEEPFRSMTDLARAVAEQISRHVSGPFALFGHSMGALAAFEIARDLSKLGCALPRCLLVSGAQAPHLPRSLAPLHGLPRDAFVDELRRLDGTSAAVLAAPELLDLLIPTLRADFEAVERYDHTSAIPIPVPIAAFGGRSDTRAPPAAVEAWRSVTDGAFRFEILDGGHFFLETSRKGLLGMISQILVEL